MRIPAGSMTVRRDATHPGRFPVCRRDAVRRLESRAAGQPNKSMFKQAERGTIAPRTAPARKPSSCRDLHWACLAVGIFQDVHRLRVGNRTGERQLGSLPATGAIVDTYDQSVAILGRLDGVDHGVPLCPASELVD